MPIRQLALVVLVLVLTACGGGGSGGNASPGAGISISVSPQTLSVSATTTSVAPTATVQLNASSVPQAGLYASIYNTGPGVAGVTLTQSGNTEDINITFNDPASLGVGVYTDTLTVVVCLDQACTQPVSNSGLKIPVTYTVTAGNPATAVPSVSGLVPSSATAGSPAFTLTVNGGNFATSSVVQWNGSPRTTSYVSATQLTAQITAADILVQGFNSVSVSNTSTGGGVSPAMSFAVGPQPLSISSIAPSVLNAGAAAFSLTVTGTGFDQYCQVYWNGSSRVTTYVSPTQLLAQISAADVALAGTASVEVASVLSPTIVTPPATFTIINATLSLVNTSPTQVTVGWPAYVQTVIGTGFTNASTVLWNGNPLVTTYVSSTELLAQVPAANIAVAGTGNISVINSGGAVSTTSAIAVLPASIDAVAFQINPQHTGAVQFANLLSGSALSQTPTWSAILDGPPSYALIAGGRVFVTVSLGSAGSELLALSASTGQKIWGPIALPYAANAAYDNGTVFTLSANIGTSGLVGAYDAVTGALRWSAVLNTQYWFTAPPTASNGFVYAAGAGGGGTVYALNESSGALAWTAIMNGGANSAPTVSADGVYLSYPCQSYDLRPLTGEYAWVYSAGCSAGGGGTGAVANGVYYGPTGSLGTSFSGLAFNAETGSILSSYNASLPPAIGAQNAYLMQSGTLRAETLANNTILWSFAGDGGLNTAPILVNNYVFVGSSTGVIYGLDAGSGALLWQTTVPGTLTVSGNGYGTLQASGLSAGDGLLIVPAGNTLSAFTLSNNP